MTTGGKRRGGKRDEKCTTLVRNLGRLYEERPGTLAICTVEDPIEFAIGPRGVELVAVKPASTLAEIEANWLEALGAFLGAGIGKETRSRERGNS